MSTRLPSTRTRDAAIWMCWLPLALVPCPTATHAAGCYSLTLEAQRLDRLVGDLCPLVVGQLTITGRE